MQIEIARMARMAETGSSLLRLIQNSHTPISDLLIRESVQNSIDAADDSDRPIRYDISAKQFEKQKVSRHFNGISEKLNMRYQTEEQTSIVIRDSNTTGLTGPLHQDYIKEDGKFGNLLKLVYEISMPQEKLGAGGSWGLGKTVYFRVGMGLVVYYSRIRNSSGNFESRLAACLVEDEFREDSLLPESKGLKRGIAWWGEQHSEQSTRPLTNEASIAEILNDFNIEPYQGDETGTTVIIPFIDREMLVPKREERSDPLWWYSDINLYLHMAIQRWYAPRIDNKSYPYGKYLLPSVNGEMISKEDMEPVYSIINTLYTTAATGKVPVDEYISAEMINLDQVELMKVLKDKIGGMVAFTKVSRDHLNMGVPHNKKSPYDYIGHEKSDNNNMNPPIVLYLRKPGMVVSYETHGKWVNGIENTPEDQYIIGVFVPNSDNTVIASNANFSLDEYLRRGEKADHSSWSDIMLDDRKPTIVDRIQNKVSGFIKQTYNEKEKETNTSRSGALSKSLAKIFLPPAGFGNVAGGGEKGNSRGGGTGISKKKGKLQVDQTYLDKNNIMIVDFSINLPNDKEVIEIELHVDSEGGRKFKGDEWEKKTELGTPFPVEIIDFTLKDGYVDRPEYAFITTKEYNVNYKIRIFATESKEISGRLHIKQSDPMIQSSIQEYIN
ncbi:hypothetical protein [Virgibacillus sp. MG-45]|uniref:hypothetical protein n=1 Tax=Virgibacillus sp. MG-45 TaxID=3102791 RepID=UPI002ED987E3